MARHRDNAAWALQSVLRHTLLIRLETEKGENGIRCVQVSRREFREGSKASVVSLTAISC